MDHNWRKRQMRRLALLLAAMMTFSTVTVRAEQESLGDAEPLEAAAVAETVEEAEETEAAEPEADETTAEKPSEIISEEVPAAAESETESEKQEELGLVRDYILGRPMTEEEILAQMALEPAKLAADPRLSTARAEEVNLNRIAFDGQSADPDNLPSAFDARKYGLLTSVKNQNPYGTCWAFGAVSGAETSMIRNKLTSGKPDLSELQLAYFFYHGAEDELGNTRGDSTRTARGVNYLEVGGHGIYTTFCLANWVGVTKESAAPYTSVIANHNISLAPELERSRDVAHMQNAYWAKMTEIPAVKLLIRRFGNASVSIAYDSAYMDYETAGYYNYDLTRTNHMVNIVGWDDNYARSNFRLDTDVLPEHDGAWLVRNDWGSDWGRDGYFWISYEDASFLGNPSFAYVYDFERANNYDNQYQYDGSFAYATKTLNSGSSVANVFTVSGAEVEELKAVSLASYSADVEYSIQIFKNPVGGDPESGIPMLAVPQTGKMSYAGYTTIPLKQSVIFHKGDTFSVVFKVAHSDGSKVILLEDKTSSNPGFLDFSNMTAPNQSYLCTGGVWKDLGVTTTGSAKGYDGETIRIKAFTRNLSGSVDPEENEPAGDDSPGYVEDIDLEDTEPEEDSRPQALKLYRKYLIMKAGEKMILQVEERPDNDEMIRWTTSDPTVATVEAGKVTGTGAGTCVVTASVGDLKAECNVTVSLGTLELESAVGYAWRKIKVTWSPLSGAEGYRIYRRDDEGKWESIADVKGSAKYYYIDTVPSETESYTYTARAFSHIGGELVLGNYSMIGVQGQAIPEMPVLKTTASASNGVKLTWGRVRCDGYKIYRKFEDEDWICVKTVKGGSKYYCTDKKAVKGRTYQYSIRAYFKNRSKYALSDMDFEGLTGKRIPKQPSLKSVKSVKTGLKVTWSRISGSGYRIYRKDPDGNWELLKEITRGSVGSYIDTTAEVGVRYVYTVCSFYKRDDNYVLSSYSEKGIAGTRK